MQQSVESVFNANNFPIQIANPVLDHCANDRVEAWGISAARQNTNASSCHLQSPISVGVGLSSILKEVRPFGKKHLLLERVLRGP